TPHHVEKRWQTLNQPEAQAQLWDDQTQRNLAHYSKNIEYFIGTVKVPVGIAGPLRVNGLHANDDFLIPLA
ncbi:hypothetical protein, partial [Escherichia coli]